MASSNRSKKFETLVEKGNIIGEVVGVDRFLVTMRGMDSAPLGSVVLFDDNNIGFVHEVHEDEVMVLSLTTEEITLGQLAVFYNDSMKVEVGPGLLGRIITPFGEPLDGKSPLNLPARSPIFKVAPGITARSPLNDQLHTGVSIVDTLFSVIQGQRIAVMGDIKTGKTTFLTQLAASQKNSNRVIVYVLIGKQKKDLELLLDSFKEQGILENMIIIASNVLDPMPALYITPYAACAIAEYFWNQGRDTVIIYDDLSNHAKAYREMSLLLRKNPGRDSYSSDIFYLHSSLLERAGKLKDKESALTAIPVVVTPNNDITGYIPTNIISITDGQIFFDTDIFQQGLRPAVNVGLSVSRVAQRARSSMQKDLAGKVAKRLAAYENAKQFSRFGAKFSDKIQRDLMVGEQLYAFFKQAPQELVDPVQQQVVLQAILMNNGEKHLDILKLKEEADKLASQIKEAEGIVKSAEKLLDLSSA